MELSYQYNTKIQMFSKRSKAYPKWSKSQDIPIQHINPQKEWNQL